MPTKRALIVDDSRSARVILGRLLENHGLAVDTAESGEQALEYLRGARPDVVFMDHLMPGMDGFQTVRAIKGNRDTASIPVLMYTSQDDEQYLEQAQKVGAAGVVSKTLMAADVARALYDLQLLPERRDAPRHMPRVETATAGVHDEPATPRPIERERPRESPQSADLANLLHAELEALAQRLGADIRDFAQQAVQLRRSSRRSWFAPALTVIALVPSVVLGVLYWRTLDDQRAQLNAANARLSMVVTDQQTQIDQLRAELARRQELPDPGAVDVALVPYGEAPLAGARWQQLKQLLSGLDTQRGSLRVTTYVGDFCLAGNPIAGYKLASDITPARKCDLIGNPVAEQPNESPEVMALRQNSDPRVTIVDGGRRANLAYPAQTDTLTAGEWNRVAARNNRVEFSLSVN